MNATTLGRRDLKVTVAGLGGTMAQAQLPGVTVFELATMPLPAWPRAEAAASGAMCAGTSGGPGCGGCTAGLDCQ